MSIGTESVVKIIIKTNGRCFYCNKPADSIDHIVPKKRWDEMTCGYMGSCDDISNLVPACRKCNSAKREKLVENFLKIPSEIIWNRIERVNKRYERIFKKA